MRTGARRGRGARLRYQLQLCSTPSQSRDGQQLPPPFEPRGRANRAGV